MAKKIFTKRYKKNEGSALLIAVIVMGILLTLSLGVSDLVITTMRDSSLLFEKTRAWYAAESGIEQALLSINTQVPGFEEAINKDTEDLKYSYSIKAKSDRLPEPRPNAAADDESQYASLRLNESITIPLFSGTSPEQNVRKFHVDYYLKNLHLQGGTNYEDLDLLRWKIFGVKRDGQEMEVISEYYPMQSGRNTYNNPSCLETGNDRGCWNGAILFTQVDGEFIQQPYDFAIGQFIDHHNQNFLVLTNMVNSDLVGSESVESPEVRKQLATIKYRVVEDDDGAENLTLPFIKITSDGFAGNGSTTQSIDLEVKRETFLPVFNYSLYRTAE